MKAAHPEVTAPSRSNPGETLRQARESRGWAVADVAVRLNLTQTALGHLEAGAFDKLPGHTFARGYIRAYAKLLGMDQIPLVEAFDQVTGTNAKGSDVHSLGRIEEPVRLSHNILRGVSLLLLVIVIGGGFVWWQDHSSQRGKDTPNLALEHVEVESADGTTQIHPIDEPEDQAVATATQPAPQVDPSVVATESAAPVEHPADAPVASAPVAAPAPVVQAPVTAVAPTAPVVAPAAPVAPVAAAPVAAGAAHLQVQFAADCWTQVTDGNGKILFSALKRKGDSLDLSGKPPFAVRLGYARGAQLTFNGQPVDVAPFTSGETARLKLGQ